MGARCELQESPAQVIFIVTYLCMLHLVLGADVCAVSGPGREQVNTIVKNKLVGFEVDFLFSVLFCFFITFSLRKWPGWYG